MQKKATAPIQSVVAFLSLLKSDESIVQTLTHEIFEIEELRFTKQVFF
jgi:hypothetical protein